MKRGVVQFVNFLQYVNKPSHLVVSLLHKTCEYLSLTGKESAVVSRQQIPVRDILRPGCQLCAGGNDACLQLALGCLPTNLIPTLVKLSFVFVGPFLEYMVWGMYGTRSGIYEKGLIRGV